MRCVWRFRSLPSLCDWVVHGHAAAMQAATKQSNLVLEHSTVCKRLPVGHGSPPRPFVLMPVIHLHRPAPVEHHYRAAAGGNFISCCAALKHHAACSPAPYDEMSFFSTSCKATDSNSLFAIIGTHCCSVQSANVSAQSLGDEDCRTVSAYSIMPCATKSSWWRGAHLKLCQVTSCPPAISSWP